MSLLPGRSSNEVTPLRASSLWLDIPQSVLQEHAWMIQREREEIARGQSIGDDLERNAAGGIQMKSVPEVTAYIHERTDSPALTLIESLELVAQVSLVSSNFRQVYRQKPSSGLGAATGADPAYNVSGQGDPYLQKTFSSTVDWSTVEDTADAAAFPKPTQPTANLPMRRVLVGSRVYPANQGFQLRFTVPGTQHHAPDSILTLYFGGSIFNGGGGQYAVTFTGDGLARLFVLLPSSGVAGGSLQWYQADTIRYANPNEVCAKAHTFIIQPYDQPGTQQQHLIEFRTSAPEAETTLGAPTQGYLQPQYSARRTLFSLANAPALPPKQRQFIAANPPVTSTGPGILRGDIRQDQHPDIQVAKLTYRSTATLTDSLFAMEVVPSGTKPMTLWWAAITPPGTSIDLHLFDGVSHSELTQQSRQSYKAVYTLSQGETLFYIQAVFHSNGTNTPILYVWTAQKDGIGQVVAPNGAGIRVGMVDEDPVLKEISITGPTGDPTHESAFVLIEDTEGSLSSPLDERASIAARIETTDPYFWPGKNIILMSGYVEEPKSEPVGHDPAYAPAGWAERRPRLLGNWVRLHEQLNGIRRPLLITDPITGKNTPLKITDAIRGALYQAGYPPDQVDVPDSYLTFWPSLLKDAMMVNQFANLGDMIVQWAADYLGWYLLWDANAGAIDGTTGRPKGMWRLKIPPQYPFYTGGVITASPVYTFTCTAPSGARTAIDHPSAYPSNTTFVYEKYEPYIVRPEGNIVTVFGASLNDVNQILAPVRAYNLISAQFFAGQSPAPNPHHQDWIGRAVDIPITDIGIAGYDAATYVCRRTFDLACHGRKMRPFMAPLMFIQASDTVTVDQGGNGFGPFTAAPAYPTGQPRPLQYYDLVKFIDPAGTQELCFVASCNPEYDFDGAQFSFYELQVIPQDLWNPSIYLETGG